MSGTKEARRKMLQECSLVVVMVVMTSLTFTCLASQQPLQKNTSEAANESLRWDEKGGRKEAENTTPAGSEGLGVLEATPEPWDGFTRLIQTLDILSALDQHEVDAYFQHQQEGNTIEGEDDARIEEQNGKARDKRRAENIETGRYISENMVVEDGDVEVQNEGEDKGAGEEEDPRNKEGRFFVTGHRNSNDEHSQVMISVDSVWSLIAWIVFCILLIKWIVHSLTGRGLDYWGQWAMNSYRGAGFGNDQYSYYPDQSTYTAYRGINEFAKKYGSSED